MIADPARRSTLLALLPVLFSGVALAGCAGREPAPQFSYTLLDGTRLSSDSLRGQVVMVNFWATTCSTCIGEMPRLIATHQRYQGQGLQTLAVAMRYDPPASVAHYAETRRLPFGVVIDNTGAIAAAFGDVAATPTTVLIDKRGRVVQRHVGEPDFAALNRQIEKLLAEA